MKLPNGLELRNRFVLAPLTHESSNDDGTINDDVITYMAQRSSDVSLALTAASNVTDLGKAFPGQPSVAHDSDLEGLTKLATAMKQNGAKAIIQIHHGGVQSLLRLTPNGDVAGPSPITMKSYDETQPHDAREMTKTEILDTITAFGEATRRAIQQDLTALRFMVQIIISFNNLYHLITIAEMMSGVQIDLNSH